jgi:ankyrin repeat protein
LYSDCADRYILTGDNFNWSPLHVAAISGSLVLFEYILKKVKNNITEGRHGLTAMHIAASQGHLEIVKFLAENGSDKNPAAADVYGFTPLHFAAMNGISGHYQVFKYIINAVDNKNPADVDGKTPLYYATLEGHYEICKLILENISDKNPASNDGVTPLHLAAQYSHSRITKLLLKNVIDKRPINNGGKTPILLAAEYGNLYVYEVLVKDELYKNPAENPLGTTPLHLAARNGYLKLVKLIVKNSIDPNPGDANGTTPFHNAAMRGHLKVCRFFLYNTILFDKNPKDIYGKTPYHLASNIKVNSLIYNYILQDEIKRDQIEFSYFIQTSDAPEFAVSVNPIPTRGADYAHHIISYPPGFENLAMSLQTKANYLDKLGPNTEKRKERKTDDLLLLAPPGKKSFHRPWSL